MSSSRTCSKGAVIIGLIAALTPGLWAQSVQEQQTVTPPGGTDAPRSLTEAQQTATARRAMLGDKISPGKRTDAPPPIPAQGGLIWFTNQAEFEAFVPSQGKFLKGIEDYEESILGPNSADAFDDPLESGVANLPDGFPFPVGMTGLPNLIVQSNFEHDLFNPNNPRGADALAAFSATAGNFVSDVVIANFSVDSLDLIFTSEKTAVGFNTLRFTGPGAMEVNVFSTTNELLGEMASDSDPAGTNFIGVWSPVPIGRINLFDVSNGAEGADNIQAWESQDCNACDTDCNGVIDALDIEPFLDLLFDWQRLRQACNGQVVAGPQVAVVQLCRSAQNFQQRRLARAVAAYQGDLFARMQGQGSTIEQFTFAVSNLGVAEPDDVHGRGGSDSVVSTRFSTSRKA